MIKKYSYKIENLNFILMFLIVCLHSSLETFVASDSVSSEVYRFFNIIFDCAVPTFLFISCYLFFRNFTLKKYKEKVFSRIHSLVIPYLIWNTLFFLYYLALSSIPATKSLINAHSFEADFNSIFSGIILGQACPQLWFLRVLFIFTLVSPMFYLLCKKCNKYIVFAVVVLLILANLILKTSYSSALFWLPLYLGGAYLTMVKKDYDVISHNTKNTIILILVWAVLIITNFLTGNTHSIIYYLYRLISPLVAIYFLNQIASNKQRFKKIDSFFIYCMHLAVIEVIRKLLVMTIGIKWHFIIYLLTIFFSLGIIFILNIILKTIAPHFYNILIGGRLKKETK